MSSKSRKFSCFNGLGSKSMRLLSKMHVSNSEVVLGVKMKLKSIYLVISSLATRPSSLKILYLLTKLWCLKSHMYFASKNDNIFLSLFFFFKASVPHSKNSYSPTKRKFNIKKIHRMLHVCPGVQRLHVRTCGSILACPDNNLILTSYHLYKNSILSQQLQNLILQLFFFFISFLSNFMH